MFLCLYIHCYIQFFPVQFVVYSGYYYFLSLLFIGAGIYKLTSTGWINSLRLCCRKQRPPSLASPDKPASGDAVGEPTESKPLIQDGGGTWYSRRMRELSEESFDKQV